MLPLGEAADEPSHFALVRFIAEQRRLPSSLEEQRPLGRKGDASPIYHGLVALITQHVDVSSLPALPSADRRPERWIPTDGYRNNILLHTEDESYPFRGIVLAWHLARLVSIPLGAMTIAAVYMTASAIYPARRSFLLAVTGLAAFLPRFVTNSAVVNDDNLVVPLTAFSIYYLIRVAQGSENSRLFAGLGVLMGLAAVAKYHALALLPEMTVVLLVTAWRNRWGWRTWFSRWAIVLLGFLLAAGWWYTYLLIRFNQVAELGWVEGLTSPFGDPVFTAGIGRVFETSSGGALIGGIGWNEWATRLFRSFWIGYGSNDVFASPTTYRVLWLVCLVAAVGWAKRGWTFFSSIMGQHPDRSYFWQSGVPVLAIHFVVYLSIVVTRYLMSPIPETAHGRHLYPAIAAIAFFIVLGWSESLGSFSRILHYLLRRAKTGSLDLAGEVPLAIGVNSSMLVLSVITPQAFILPHFPYLPITTIDTAKLPMTHRIHIDFADGLDFEGYDLGLESAKAGEVLPITFYWHAGARQSRDYLVRVCLNDHWGNEVTCHQGHPVDGRYPVRAWEVGQSIRDVLYLAIPYCVTPGEYNLTLSLLPLRQDTAFTAIDRPIVAREPIVLGKTALAAAERPRPSSLLVWVGDSHYSGGEIELVRIRQSLTVINYWSNERVKTDDLGAVRFVPANEHRITGLAWNPMASAIVYHCPGGPSASVHNFLVDPGLPPRRYRLQTTTPANGELFVTVGTRLRDFNTPSNIPIDLNASFNEEIELLGYKADFSPIWPGDTIHITTYWRSLRTMSRAYVASFHLLDNEMRMWGQTDRFIGSHYSNVLWAPGELVEETYSLRTDKQSPPGLYYVEFSIYDYVAGTFQFLPVITPVQSGTVENIRVGHLRVKDPAGNKEPSHPLAVQLGDEIQLLGYDLSATRLTQDENLSLTLYWEAIRTPTNDYTVFTQLIGPDGMVWGQMDNQPQGGHFPTTAWTLNGRVVDRYDLKLRENSPLGEYRLLVGMYELSTGQRLTATSQNGERFANDAIPLATLIAN